VKKKKLAKALRDLDKAFENLEIQPLAKDGLGRVVGGTFGCTDSVTCNFKCGPTGYWECVDSEAYESCVIGCHG